MTQEKKGNGNEESDAKSLTRYEKFENFLPSLIPKLQAVWLKTIPFDEARFVGMTLNLFLRNPRILMCEPVSVIGALKQCAEYALYPDALRGHAWIIPRKDKDIGRDRANFQIGYKGILVLLRRAKDQKGEPVVHSGKAVEAELVFKDDYFLLEKGLNPKLSFIPNLDADDPAERELRLVYAMINYREGLPDFGYMLMKQLHEIEQVYSKASKEGTPWTQSTVSRAWMMKKTVIIQVAKLSPALDDETVSKAIALDEKLDLGLDQGLHFNVDRDQAALAAKMLSEDAVMTVVVEGAPKPVEGKSSLDQFVEGKEAKPIDVKPEHNKPVAEKVADAEHVAAGEPPKLDKGKIDKGTDPPKDKPKPEPSPPPPETTEAKEKRGLKEERIELLNYLKAHAKIVETLWDEKSRKAIVECKAIKDLRFYAGQVTMKKDQIERDAKEAAKPNPAPPKEAPSSSEPPPPGDEDAPPNTKSETSAKGAENETSKASEGASDDWSSLME